MDIPLKKVLSIGVGDGRETAVVELQNGDRLKGAISLDPIELVTVFGAVKVGIEHVRQIQVGLSGGDLSGLLARDLVFYYSFEKEENGWVSDAGSNGLNGTVRGAQWTADGRRGGAYRFDGRKDVITVQAASSDYDDVTVCAWIRPVSFDTDGACWNPVLDTWWGDNGGQTPFRLGFWNVRTQGAMVWQYAKDGAGVDLESSALPLDVWTHVAGVRTYEAGAYTLTLYINGARGKSITSDRLPAKSASQEMAIGARTRNPGNDERFHGTIDEVFLFRRALSEAEVRQILGVGK